MTTIIAILAALGLTDACNGGLMDCVTVPDVPSADMGCNGGYPSDECED